jgi:hypothetical protein
MLRILIAVVLLAFPSAAFAHASAPGQAIIGKDDILRGHFVEQRNLKGFNKPMKTTGHFVVAPADGLIWSMDQPFPTSTVITPAGLVQLVGSAKIMSMSSQKIPFTLHLYDMLAGALAGNWAPLSEDFKVTESGDVRHWKFVLEPINDNPGMPYSSITITGSRYVETALLTKADGDSDSFTFTDQTVGATPPSSVENAAFRSVGP